MRKIFGWALVAAVVLGGSTTLHATILSGFPKQEQDKQGDRVETFPGGRIFRPNGRSVPFSKPGSFKPGARIRGQVVFSMKTGAIEVEGNKVVASLGLHVAENHEEPGYWTYLPRVTITDLVSGQVVLDDAYHEQEFKFDKVGEKDFDFEESIPLHPGLYSVRVEFLAIPKQYKGDTLDHEATRNFVKWAVADMVLVK